MRIHLIFLLWGGKTPTIIVNSAWAELSLGGGPPLYLDPGIVALFHSILQSIQAVDTEKIHGLLIVLIKLLWRDVKQVLKMK